MTEKKLKETRDSLVKKLRSNYRWIIFEANRLEATYLEDAKDLEIMQDIAKKVEDRAAEAGELMEEVHVLAGDLKTYIQQQQEEIARGVDIQDQY